jgi:hypothetical protein
MAKTTATKKTAAATKKAAPKNTAAKPTAIKRKAAKPAPVTAANIDWKQALIGGGVGALVGGLVTKVIFLR